MGFILVILYILFIVSSLVLTGVILLQEGKGGGFAEAFAGVGGETFGVRASGIHKFTGVVAGIFIVTAIFISMLRGQAESVKTAPEPAPIAPVGGQESPGQPPAGDVPPGEGGSTSTDQGQKPQ